MNSVNTETVDGLVDTVRAGWRRRLRRNLPRGPRRLSSDEAKVTENASFIDDLGADSLDTVELVMALEEEFGCEIPDDAAEKIATVKDAVSFIQDSGGSRASVK